MKQHFLRHFLRIEYLVASILACVMVFGLTQLDDILPDTDETSFLSPLLGRIDFLNISDISLDAIFAIRDMHHPDPRLRVVNIGQTAPVPLEKIALLLYKLKADGARVVGIDVLYDEKMRERAISEGGYPGELITSAFRDNPNVVLVSGFGRIDELHAPEVIDSLHLDPDSLTSFVEILPDVREAVRHYGFANLTKDDDEVIRRFWPFRTVDGKRQFAFPVELVRLYDSSLVQPLVEPGEMLQIINYNGTNSREGFPNGTLNALEIDAVLRMDPAVGKQYFKDAIVLVGFVGEGGMSYLGDMWQTPMGRKIGLKGPDMPGLLVHANIVDMLLKRQFITPAPAWVDWSLALLLAYLSIALYRVLRVKAVSQSGIGFLITTMLMVETMLVFFFPILAFFFFGTKISYNLMATIVIIFIPAAALVTKGRVMLLGWRAKRIAGASANPIPQLLHAAFEDDEALPLHLRLLHAAQVLLGTALAIRFAELQREGQGLPAGWRIPGVGVWTRAIPEIAAVFRETDATSEERQHFYNFLAGRKDQFLRDSAYKELLFSTQLIAFNEFFYFDEWEILVPHVFREFTGALGRYTRCRFLVVDRDGATLLATDGSASAAEGVAHLPEGFYFETDPTRNDWTRVSPFIEYCECKLHRTKEVFVFAALVPRQFGMAPQPVYYGSTPACDPVLPEDAPRALLALPDAPQTIDVEEMTDTVQGEQV
jgi:CHASE2 domain-containing sensor protein